MKENGSKKEKALKVKRLVSYLLPAIIFALALWTLDKQMSYLHLSYVLKSISSVPLSHLGIAVFLTSLSYASLTGYDYLAARHINQTLPYKEVARTSFISTSISYTAGFNFLTGGSLRYRLYSGYGLSLAQIWDIIVFCISTFWVGFCFIAGLLFTFYPLKLSEYVPGIPVPLNLVGILLLLLLVTYFYFSFTKLDLEVKGHKIRIPEPKIAFMQLALSSGDYLLPGSIIYLLLPSNSQLTLLHVLLFFALAQLIGLISTVPGGLGVFETVMLFMLEPYFGTVDIMRALVLFRFIYYFVPFLMGFLTLIFHEFEEKKEFLKKSRKGHLFQPVRNNAPDIFYSNLFRRHFPPLLRSPTFRSQIPARNSIHCPSPSH